ncbi:MAG: DUF5683 domain-containing protein [Chitinophagaceae bacterium]
MRFIQLIIIFFLCFIANNIFAQDTTKQKIPTKSLFDSSNVRLKDSTPVSISKKDSVIAKPKHDPQKATIRSAILPGWGQAYNHEYWKIPIVYGALGVTAGFFIYNNTWYHRTNTAFNIVINKETDKYGTIYYKLQPLLSDSVNVLSNLQYYRNQFRKDRDYSVLYFFIAWGLNVVDATVFGHLKEFDVSNNLSINISPGFNTQTKTPNVGLVFNFKTPSRKNLSFNN